MPSSRAETTAFCRRSSSRESCPDPPTSAHVDLNAYTGTWYQVASTARYKLSFDSGLVCEQANYTFVSQTLGAARISAVNSGAAVISRTDAAILTRQCRSTDGICSAAIRICSAVTPPDSRLHQNIRLLARAADTLSSSHPSVSAGLVLQTRRTAHLARIVESDVDALAANVSAIQQTYGRISQDEGLRRENLRELSETISFSLTAVWDFSYQISRMDSIRSEILHVAATLAGENPSLAFQISRAAFQIAAEFSRIQSNLANVATLLDGLEASAAILARSSGGATNFRAAPPVMYGLGFQNGSSPGKLEMDFYGVSSPYWIIGLEGSARKGYDAAMVYWCREGLNGGIYEDLFLLSRSGKLRGSILGKFTRMAAEYGIYLDCDNPLIFTDQRGGSCGAP